MTHFSAHLTCHPSRTLSELPDQRWKHTSQPPSSVSQASATTCLSPISSGRRGELPSEREKRRYKKMKLGMSGFRFGEGDDRMVLRSGTREVRDEAVKGRG